MLINHFIYPFTGQSFIGMAILPAGTGTRRVPDPSGTGSGTKIYPQAVPVPDPSSIRVGRGYHFLPVGNPSGTRIVLCIFFLAHKANSPVDQLAAWPSSPAPPHPHRCCPTPVLPGGLAAWLPLPLPLPVSHSPSFPNP
jgi:hypothetical protein